MKKVTILTGEPTIIPTFQMARIPAGIEAVADWVRTHRPECLPENYRDWKDLFPHDLLRSDGTPLSDNELSVELAGRKCYDSFGLKAGRKTNADYISNTQAGEIPHASILYHAKMTFFFAGVSRRVSHEIIRNYVGADRDEEGAPSQESTRFTHHYGFFICPPRYIETAVANDALSRGAIMQHHFETSMQSAYDNYLIAVRAEVEEYERAEGRLPTGIEKKRIYEAASSFLPHQAETSFVWTTNPAAIAKFVRERADQASDLEIQRFARKWRRVCVERWPNLFPQPFMQDPFVQGPQ